MNENLTRAIFIGKGHKRINFGQTGTFEKSEFNESDPIQFWADGFKESLWIYKKDIYIPLH